MPLTQQVKLRILAGLVKLAAVEPLPGAGATIAQQAAAHAGAGAAHAGGGHGAPKKVATARGAAHYHVPLGSLIIPHEHFIAGEPSHWGHDISQAKWVANEWKKKPEADEAAHKAVEAGTHRWVQAGGKEFAVHKGVEVHVPKATDTGDQAKTASAPKLFVHHGANPERLTVTHFKVGEPAPLGGTDKDQISSAWKVLHQADDGSTGTKSVSFGGKHAAWVPSDWQVYKAANTAEPDVVAKWAKDPQGGWHLIDKAGKVHDVHASLKALPKWVAKGILVPDDNHAADHGLPPAGDGAQPGKVDVGGVAVTKAELQSAIEKLHGSKSTQIKGLLKDHPLGASDYGSVYKAELEKHPHLKVPPGTKKAHVPEAKNAFIHHLAAKVQELSNSEGEAAAAKAVTDKTEAVADHAQELTPHEITVPKDEEGLTEANPEAHTEPVSPANLKTPEPDAIDKQAAAQAQASPPEAELPADLDTLDKEQASPGTVDVTGITANKEDIQGAIDALNASKSTAIKQVLKAKGNKLQDADYWSVIHAYEAAHPNTSKGKGTKQAHVPNAKSMFISALQEKLDGLAKADQLTGHDDSAELYDLVKNGTFASDASTAHSDPASVAWAAKKAVANDHNYYVWLQGGEYKVSAIQPAVPLYYKVTPELKMTVHNESSPAMEAKAYLAKAVHEFIAPPKESKAKEGQEVKLLPPEPPDIKEVLSDAKKDAEQTKEWKADPGWQALDDKVKDLIEHPDEKLYKVEDATTTKQRLATLLAQAAHWQEKRYLVAKSDGGWEAADTPPHPGTYAAVGLSWYEIRPDHQVILHSPDGTLNPMPMKFVTGYVENGTKPPKVKAEVLDSPPPEPKNVVVTAGSYTATAPSGSAVFQANSNLYYIRHPDGSWHMLDKYDGHVPVNKTSHQTMNSWAAGGDPNVHLTAWNEAAKVFQSAQPEKPEPKAPPGPDVKVSIHGKHVASFPAGTKVYVNAEHKDPLSKFAKTPDGQWHWITLAGAENSPSGNTWDQTVAESSTFKLESPRPAAPEPEAPAAEKPEETQPGVPAIYKGEVKGEWPPGSQLYTKSGSYAGTFAKDPEGKWWKVQDNGVVAAPPYQVGDASGMTVTGPPTAEQLADAKDSTELKALVKTGSVDPAKAIGGYGAGKVYKTWQLAMAAGIADKKLTGYNAGGDVVVNAKDLANGDSGYVAGYVPDSTEHWTFQSSTMQVTHSAPGVSEKIPLAQLLEAAKRYVVPDTVVVEGKQYKYGWWKKPKGSAYLEIKTYQGYVNTYKHGTAAFAEYHYHAKDGSVKEVTPAAAAKYLEGAEHLAEEPKPDAVTKPVGKVTHVTVASPGTYLLYSVDHAGPHPDEALDLKSDGSGVHNPYGTATSEKTVSNILKSGMVLDQYGNSVVRPGTPATHFHLFGGHTVKREQLEEFKTWLEDNFSVPYNPWTTELNKVLGHSGSSISGYKHVKLLQQFIDKAGVKLDGTAQRNTVYQLVKEMLAVPQMPEGASVSGAGEAPKEVAYLKTLPAGIASSADIFKFTADGWAHPFSGNLALGFNAVSVPDLKELIGQVSEQFGGGKVVGTHLSVPKYQLVDWLNAWKKGDMQAVFAIDAGAGKVSPAHPGAPDNAATHAITWAPADPLQIPASKDVKGAWTDLKYGDVPAKEADNYLLAMNFQYGEYLSPGERQQVVKAHRLHNQEVVDHHTKLALTRYEAPGDAPWSAPEYTEGLKPAKPYTAWLQKGEPAAYWSAQATKSFVEDHQAELAPYAAQVATESGYTAEYLLNPDSSASYLHEQVIQEWLDDAHAKEVAAQMVPVWKKVPTGNLPSHGHEVWKAVQEIPYTGEKSTWFVKPAPDGKAFRIEQEHAANLLGALFGFRTAESRLLDDVPAFGQLVQAQKAVPGEPLGHYTDMPAWDSFSPKQIADMAMEHVLDAVLFNDDTSANNMIKTPDGHLVGIDKGRSWGNMDWKRTAGTADMDSMTQLVYTKLYDAIRSGQVSKDVADQAYTAVIQKARKMSMVPDASVRKILEQGFAHRTKFGEGGKEALVQKILDAKNSLEHDFQRMWEKVYEKAGFGAEAGDFGTGKPWGEVPAANARFGMVVFNDKGEVLLREVKNHYAATAWSFAKGGANPGESPLQAATREAAEELKWKFNPVGYVPGGFAGKESTNYYYLASAKGGVFVPEMDNGETEQTKWVSLDEAKELLALSESKTVVQRDLAVLDAAAQEWGSGKYDAEPIADPGGLGSPLPLVPVQKLPTAPGGHQLYAGFTEPGLMDSVAAGKSHGVPVFFGGPELRDMHMLLWQSSQSDGTLQTKGETFLKGEGYDKVLGWLSTQAGKDAAPGWDDKQTVYTKDSMPGQAHDASPDRGGIAKEKSYYNTIIKAARTVTRHKSDGKYNADVLENMATAGQDIMKLMQGADAILSTQPDHEWAKNAKEMGSYYNDLISQVLKAKEGGYGFTEGQLPRWLPSSSEPNEEAKSDLEKLGYKVTYGHTSPHPSGKLSATHDLKESGHGGEADPGKWYHVTLPEGETIEVGNGNASGVALVHHGRVRFTTTDHSAASLERVRAAMQMMGLSMKEAEARDFETFYWRHLLSILDDRQDGHTGARQAVWDEMKNQFSKRGLSWGYADGNHQHAAVIKDLQNLGAADPEAETSAYRAAFAKLTSDAQVEDWAARGGFLPHLKHFDPNNPSQAGGKPDWYRFDLAAHVASLPAPIRQSTSSHIVAEATVKSGGTYGRDSQMRVLGTSNSGLSNPYTSGGPAYVFTRVNTGSAATMWSPLALARSHNYAFSDDSFGEWNQRKASSSWDHGIWSKYSGSSNEHMISDALSVLDDLELVTASSEGQRQELIKYLKDRGITHIRFMPVEDRVVLKISATEKAKVQANWKAHPELLDPLAEPYLYTGEAGPGQTAFDPPSAADAALDTSASAKAADAGSDPHLKFILDQMASQGKVLQGVYQPPNPNIYYVHLQSGSWASYEVEDGGTTGPFQEGASVSELLDGQIENGQLTQVHGGDPSAGWKPDSGYSSAMVLVKGDYKIIQSGSGGASANFHLYKKSPSEGWDNPVKVGQFDSLGEAQQVAT